MLFSGYERKGSKGKSESPWSLHMGIFWEIHFINPPEVHGQFVRAFFYRKDNDDATVPKSLVLVNSKIDR
jgi:hypothetical protein